MKGLSVTMRPGLLGMCAIALAAALLGGGSSAGAEPRVHFANDVVPILTKFGCNSGGCHGRASGQNGFKLSLFGYEPLEDYQHIVKEARGRRVSPSAPEQSLLLRKATNSVPHNGGMRLDPNSPEYATLVTWIRQGLELGEPEPTLQRITVSPSSQQLEKHSSLPLQVTAYFSDGASRDVTATALFDPVDKAMASVTEQGLVTVSDVPGDAGIMVRYQGQVAVFRARVPLGPPLAVLPATYNFVDEHVFNKLQALGIAPSADCDDATFLRRVTLDLAGRLPTIEEVKAFSSEENAQKRAQAIDRLLDSDDYAEFFASKWSALLRNRREDPSYERGCILFWQWVRDSLASNKPYDQFARELLTASGDVNRNPPVAWYRTFKEAHVQMEDVAQLFMGTRLQCAQCHHHPFEKWSQNDYLALAAYFSQIGRKTLGAGKNPAGNVAEEIIVHKRGNAQLLNKKTKESIKPAALGASVEALSPDDDPRQALANWLVGESNPFFARTLVNRYWKHFLGRGIIEPEDDLRDTNPASNPELLDALVADFVAHHFDMKHLVRTILNSRTYQLSAIPNSTNATDQQNFSRYHPKRLMAEVLLDSVNSLASTSNSFKSLAPNTRAVALPDNSYNSSSLFLSVFGRPDAASACECERTSEASLAQSLHLLNADEVQQKLSSNSGRAAALAKDKRSDADKVSELYLLALSRSPSGEELQNALSFLVAKNQAGVPADQQVAAQRQAWEDLLWSMLNTKEFLFNH